jgi:hypothetical protein
MTREIRDVEQALSWVKDARQNHDFMTQELLEAALSDPRLIDAILLSQDMYDEEYLNDDLTGQFIQREVIIFKSMGLLDLDYRRTRGYSDRLYMVRRYIEALMYLAELGFDEAQI